MNSFERRLKAFSIDSVILFLLMMVLLPLKLKPSTFAYLLIGIYFTISSLPYLLGTGQSFGKRIQKIKVVKNVPGEVIINYSVPNRFLLLLRDIVKNILILITFGLYMFIGGIISQNRKDGRSLHDLIFNTRVIAITKYTNDLYEFGANKK